jgi:hypothetical protein
MNMKDQLQILVFIIGIMTSVIGAIWFLWKHRKNAIKENYKTLACKWTNEGDIHSVDTKYITLDLMLKNGDLFGTIESPKLENGYEAHVTPGWFTSKLEISELSGRNIIPKSTVRLRIKGNKNRLKWNAKTNNETDILPNNTTLWPL